jgi:hypothetical protein
MTAKLIKWRISRAISDIQLPKPKEAILVIIIL